MNKNNNRIDHKMLTSFSVFFVSILFFYIIANAIPTNLLVLGILALIVSSLFFSISFALLKQPKIDARNNKITGLANSIHVKRFGKIQNNELLNKTKNEYSGIEGSNITVKGVTFNKNDIQWLGRYKKTKRTQGESIRLDVNVDGSWYKMSIHSVGDQDFADKLLQLVPEKLKRSRFMYRPEVRTYTGIKANITTQNLQGIFEKFESVELHITPLWLVILHNGHVIQQHFIDDISDIRSTKHPTDLDDAMLLLTFEVGEKAFAYALKDRTFATRLSDASREGIDSAAARKKKKQDTES